VPVRTGVPVKALSVKARPGKIVPGKAVPVETAAVETAAERADHVAPGGRQRGGQRVTEPALANDGQARPGEAA